jgi:membrane protein
MNIGKRDREKHQKPDEHGDRKAVLPKDVVRSVSAQALQGTMFVGKGASHLAREAVSSAIQAVNEVGGEAGAFVKDAVMVVIEGTSDVAKNTTPVIRSAVEGAVRGAASVGITTQSAVEQASQGVIEAVQEAGGDLGEAARATVGGVISGVVSTGGNVQKAALETVRELIGSAAEAGEDVVSVARGAVEDAIEASRETDLGGANTVQAVAFGAIEAAYQIDGRVGDAVRSQVIGTLAISVNSPVPAVQTRYDEAVQGLSEQLGRRRGGWRVQALWFAGQQLVERGGLDLSASLAYFTILSFFPLIALVILIFASFADTDTVRQQILEVLLFYFPASRELLDAAISHVFNARLQVGLVAVGAMIMGANGLFMAANRAVNRIFGTRPKKVMGTTVTEVVLTAAVVLLFLAALSMTVVFQVALQVSAEIPALDGPLAQLLVDITEIVAGVLPFLLTTLVFTIAYHTIPNRVVGWKDATFGGIVAVILFELAKHTFFWFTAMSSERSLLYGTLSSVIILLIWSSVAGMIFLYGAAIAREASRLRPGAKPDSAYAEDHAYDMY